MSTAISPRRSRNQPRAHRRRAAALRAVALSTPANEWQTVNVSEGGLFVRADQPLPPGTLLDLGLWLIPDTDTARITSKVEVVWTNDRERSDADPNLPTGMGVKFLALGGLEQALYRQFLFELENQQSSLSGLGPAQAPSPNAGEVTRDGGGRLATTISAPDAADDLPPDDGVLSPGMVLGSYRVLRHVGAGGMGDVYVAEHIKLGRRVALKRLNTRFASDRLASARFFAEARVVNEICHPHIVEINDFCATSAHPYFVMELLHGQTLAELLESDGPLRVDRLLHIAVQLSDVLAAVHRANVVHRDFKPQNIFLVNRDGVRDFVKLLDFGIAKLDLPRLSEGKERTESGVFVGTPAYAAPEQFMGTTVDHRTDIYAFGVVLFKMATGRPPFLAEGWGDLMLQQATDSPPRPRRITNNSIPKALESLILQCLQREPDRRPASMDEVHLLLKQMYRTVMHDKSWGRVPRWSLRSSRAALWITLVSMLAGLAAAAAATWFDLSRLALTVLR